MIFYLIIIKIKPFDFLFFNFNGWALLPSLAELFCSLSAYQYRKQSTLNDMLLHFNYFYVQNLEPQRRQKQSKAPLFFQLSSIQGTRSNQHTPSDRERKKAHNLKQKKTKDDEWMWGLFFKVFILYISSSNQDDQKEKALEQI